MKPILESGKLKIMKFRLHSVQITLSSDYTQFLRNLENHIILSVSNSLMWSN